MKPDKKASEMSVRELAQYIDQSVLKPEFTENDIRKYIQEGIDVGCKTVCINPASLDIAHELTQGTETKICVVCDFPFGLATTHAKALLAEEYCKRGDIFELDIVSNYGWIRSGKLDAVREDIKPVVEICHSYHVAVKTILETDALTVDETLKGCDAVIDAGTDFVKTSTGFYTGGENKGATTEIIKAMMEHIHGRAKIKGSGCIRTREHFLELIDLGIDRMGIGYRSTPIVLGLKK